MSIWKQKNKILVTCPKGVAPYLKAEIETLGFPVLNEIDTAIQTEGTLEDTMFLNLYLRTAQRCSISCKYSRLHPPALFMSASTRYRGRQYFMIPGKEPTFALLLLPTTR